MWWILFHDSILQVYFIVYLNTVVPTYPQRICSRTPTGCLKLQIVLNPLYTMFFPIYTFFFT